MEVVRLNSFKGEESALGNWRGIRTLFEVQKDSINVAGRGAKLASVFF